MFHTDEIIPIGLRSPHPGLEVIAVTTRYRCLARMDAQGTWYHTARNEKLDADVVGWIDLALPATPPPGRPAPQAPWLPAEIHQTAQG